MASFLAAVGLPAGLSGALGQDAMKHFIAFVIVAAGIGLMAATAAADQSEPGANPPVSVMTADSPSVGEIVIDEVSRRLIRDYYQRHYDDYVHEHGTGKGKGKKQKGLPPGLAKREQLPPGLEKQLARNGHLPPGLEGRDLPPDLIRDLPRLHADYRYVIANDKVMLVRRATNLILDVLTVAAID
jgi:hypothetical protein